MGPLLGSPRKPGASLSVFCSERSSLLALVSSSHLAVLAGGKSRKDSGLGSFPDVLSAAWVPPESVGSFALPSLSFLI